MRYKWNIEKLRIARGKIEEIARQIDDDDIRKELESIFNLYTSMIKLTTKKHNEFSPFNDNLYGYDINELINCAKESYNENNLPLINVLLQSFFAINEWNPSKNLNNMRIAATNDDLVDIAINFYKTMTPNDISKKFYDLLDEKDKINFSFMKDSEKEQCDYAGITLFDPVLKEKYIHINRSNHLTDIVVLPHESFHYIFNPNDVSNITDYNTYYLTEVEGAFANILFSDYHEQVAYKQKNFFKDYYKKTYQSQIDDLVTRNALLDSLKKDKIRYKKFNKYLSYFNVRPFLSDEEIIPYLEIPEEVHIKYALSYLVAIDLYYIYLKDKDLAFYLLKNIKTVFQEDDILKLLRLNHITFMEDDYNNLKRYLKK